MPYHLAIGVTHCTSNGAIYGKYISDKDFIFHRPDEAVLFVMKKLICAYKIFLLRTFKDVVLIGSKKNEKSTSTYLD